MFFNSFVLQCTGHLRKTDQYNKNSYFCGIWALFAFRCWIVCRKFWQWVFFGIHIFINSIFNYANLYEQKTPKQTSENSITALTHSCVKYIDANADTYLLHLCLDQISFCTDSLSSLVPILQARKKDWFSQFSLAI